MNIVPERRYFMKNPQLSSKPTRKGTIILSIAGVVTHYKDDGGNVSAIDHEDAEAIIFITEKNASNVAQRLEHHGFNNDFSNPMFQNAESRQGIWLIGKRGKEKDADGRERWPDQLLVAYPDEVDDAASQERLRQLQNKIETLMRAAITNNQLAETGYFDPTRNDDIPF